MKRVAMLLLGVVFVACVLVSSNTSEAATSLVGTWTGTTRCATPTGFVSGTFSHKILSQNAAGLFRGTVTKLIAGQTYNSFTTGYISGTQIHVTEYDAGGTQSFWDATYTATTPPTAKGYVRTLLGVTCVSTAKKQ